ncbi:Subtilisin-like protease [Apostasia shenzhenica]|uniref:Subtilisin-like protease n=1 Tax=Apostasia shenzhenica TaxID=1088818 RepID=A0A2I0A9T3_9ASPA|nr:Subtilisin-like protease [Apostasia shenzhenica]
MDPRKFYLLLSFVILIVAYLVSFFFFIEPPSGSSASNLRRFLPLFGLRSSDGEMNTYIVHVLPRRPSSDQLLLSTEEERLRYHMSFLPVTPESSGEPRLIYSYSHVISGFAARLTAAEVRAMEAREGFLSANIDVELSLETTHSPTFMGLKEREPGLWRRANYGKGIIIGIVDTGIKPTHPSFRDDGVDPPPVGRWKGSCNFTDPTLCNNKLIGAKGFNGQQRNPPLFDTKGHGTEVASIAAGNFVDGAEVLGNAMGRAAGIAPLAHLAVYKVCFEGCRSSDILAGINEAIRDGVDVLSISLGRSAVPFNEDEQSIGAFSAVNGAGKIFVSCSAGNRGPSASTVGNDAPWIMTVGAGSIDRTLEATVKLGDGREFHGESAYQPQNVEAALVYPGDQNAAGRYCDSDFIPRGVVQKKIVMCFTGGGKTSDVQKGKIIKSNGGAGLIVMNDVMKGSTIYARLHFLPASSLNFTDSNKIIDYYKANPDHTAKIEFKGTLIPGNFPAPAVPDFSSRGPSKQRVNGGILKPDIIGPGHNILSAAISRQGPEVPGSSGNFTLASGTSFAAPHIAGLAALLKAIHPEWSPEAIKSAIMTTASTEDNAGSEIVDQTSKRASLFAIGGGHVNSPEAGDPGLVYEKEDQQRYDDYVSYLCGLYTDRQVTAITSSESVVNCSQYESKRPEELNYPSIATIMNLTGGSRKLERVVKNVGVAALTYKVKIVNNGDEVEIQVSPENLQFTKMNERKSFEVTINAGSKAVSGKSYEAQLIWESQLEKQYKIRSPISVTFL